MRPVTTVQDLGERALVERLAQLPTVRDNVAGLRDDAAALPLGDGTLLVASTDTTAEPTHYPPASTPQDRGWYAAAVTVSDIASMGARPQGLLLAAGLPPDTLAADAEAMLQGFDACTRQAGAEVLGGDTKEQPTLTLTSTGLGRVHEDELLLRSGARPGDVLCVTGDLGGAAAGLAALQEDPRNRDAALRLLRPPTRVEEARILAKGGATACMDVSDGVAATLHQVADASGTGFVLEADALPLHPHAPSLQEALTTGGDFELLATVPPERVEDLVDEVAAAGGSLTPVGRAVEPGPRVLDHQGEREPLAGDGWEHFRSPRRNP